MRWSRLIRLDHLLNRSQYWTLFFKHCCMSKQLTLACVGSTKSLSRHAYFSLSGVPTLGYLPSEVGEGTSSFKYNQGIQMR